MHVYRVCKYSHEMTSQQQLGQLEYKTMHSMPCLHNIQTYKVKSALASITESPEKKIKKIKNNANSLGLPGIAGTKIMLSKGQMPLTCSILRHKCKYEIANLYLNLLMPLFQYKTLKGYLHFLR